MKSARPKFTYLIANPSCLVGPAIWFQKTKSASLHRRLLKSAWPTRPRFQWYTLLLASSLGWYLCFFWVQFFRCMKSAGFKNLENKGVGRKRQIADLLYLGLWYGVRPVDYYVFNLYGETRSKWPSYVFSQEQLTWHRVFSCPPEATSDALINDKHAFEKVLCESGVQTTTTIDILKKSASVDKSLLFQNKDLFIKPNSANAMRGCLKLDFDAQKQVYRLQGFDLERNKVELLSEQVIYEFLEEIRAHEDMLVQEVLKNSEEMSALAERDDLVTVKAFTGFCENLHIAYLLLEMPGQKEGEWTVCPIDTQTGGVKFEHLSSQNKAAFLEDDRKNFFVPEFDQIKSILEKAHSLVPDVKTLCWDICITSKGICIIEANTGWGLASPQQVSGTPLLASELLDCYS